MINEDSDLVSILDSRRDEIIKLLEKDYNFCRAKEITSVRHSFKWH